MGLGSLRSRKPRSFPGLPTPGAGILLPLLSLGLSTLLAGTAGAELLRTSETNPRWYGRALYHYGKMPAEVRAINVRIQQTPGRDWSRYIVREFNGGVALIEMPRWSLKTFRHEMGHHAHEVIGWERYAGWLALWGEYRSLLPTSYARTHHAEGFAECYARWIARGSLHRVFQEYFDRLFPDLSEGRSGPLSTGFPEPDPGPLLNRGTSFRGCIRH